MDDLSFRDRNFHRVKIQFYTFCGTIILKDSVKDKAEGGTPVKMVKRWIGIAAFGISIAVLLLSLLCFFSAPAESGLFRPGLPTADEVIDSVKEDGYEKLEGKTNLIKEYIRVLIENLF